MDADAGAVVVTNVNTGEILALASYPTYDPNAFVKGISYDDWDVLNNNVTKPMFNRAVQGKYSPGSTYKMITALAGLNAKTITIDEKIQDKGIYPYGYNPLCWIYAQKGMTHGYVTVSDAIKVSCNYYFYEVGRRTDISEIIKFAKMFGLDEKTGIELVQENTGEIAGTQNIDWYLGDTLSAAIGQSYNSFTPVEMCNYIATLANGGSKNRLTLIKNVEDTNNGYVAQEKLQKYIEQVTNYIFDERKLDISSEYIDTVLEGMHRSAKESGGGIYYIFGNSSIDVARKNWNS